MEIVPIIYRSGTAVTVFEACNEIQMSPLEDALIEQMSSRCRVILIANSELSRRDIHTLGIRDTDIVVQFNKCIHARTLSEVNCRKAFVFSHNHLDSAFGFSESGEPEESVLFVLQNVADIQLMAFTYRLPEKIRLHLEKYQLSKPPLVLAESDIANLIYPSSKIPSIGYVIFSLLMGKVRSVCLKKKLEYFVYCVGFRGRTYEEGEEVFHDFIFEKASIIRSDAYLHRSFDM